MEPVVFAAVLAAAAMHATWNALARGGGDRFSFIVGLALFQSGAAVLLLPFLPAPGWAAAPWLVASALLHTGYKICLIRAYEHGEFGQVYPIARGSAPLVVAAVGAFWLGEHLSPVHGAGLMTVAAGVMLVSRGVGGGPMTRPALAFALATAAFTASYTLVDGAGARIAVSASSFAVWMFAGDGLAMITYALCVRGRRAFAGVVSRWRVALVGGVLSLGSYWIAIWAFTEAPIALVAALRETSVLFALLIGAVFLKERLTVWRTAAVLLIAAGVAALKW